MNVSKAIVLPMNRIGLRENRNRKTIKYGRFHAVVCPESQRGSAMLIITSIIIIIIIVVVVVVVVVVIIILVIIIIIISINIIMGTW